MIAIERCRLSDQCTQRWQALEEMRDNPRVRYCGQCQSAVHLVEHESELMELVRQGKSVAVLRKDLLAITGMPDALGREE